MHPFCFTASQRDPAVATSSSHSGALAELLNMPHPPSTPSYRSHSATHRRNISSSTTTTRGGGGGSSSSTTAKPANHRLIQRSASESLSRLPSVRINDIVGNGISGILYKWVNYGKGWRPRWFLLQDGVLSYYKIHGPDKIIINQQTEKGCKIIGQDSLRRITRRPHSQPLPFRRKPFGEIHLKVSSIRESRSDDKRFSIYTGTKRLHLRAETREDRGMWMEALQAVKDMFPRMSNSELMAQMGNSVALSTDKLRQRLLEEGVTEAAIQDSEQIMKSEFSALRNHLLLLKQKQLLLLDTMRQLETEKVDLENTVVDESQRQSKDQETSSRLEQDKYSDGSPSESDDDNDIHDAMEEETDDDNNAFFDTRDYLSSSSVRSNGSDIRRSSFDSEDDVDLDSDDGIDSCIRSVGTNHPHVRRRKRLPDPVEKENGVSLWSMIKDNIGKDLTKVCLPVYFNEPISSLQKCFEDLEYSYLLDRAYEWGKMGNSLMRILNVAAFAVSGYSSTDGRNCKPFNPLLGETYEAEYPDKGLRFVSEKVSHHPTIVACHCEGRGWKFWGDSNLKSKFWGRSIQLDPVGVLSLEFDDGEVFQWSKVTTSIYNLILGKLYCDHYGTMHVQGNRDYSCKIKFKEQSIIDRNPHQVQGIVQDKNGKKVATLLGKWDESLHYFNGDCSGKGKGSDLSEAHLLWKRSKPSRFPTRYNLTRFAITLNELTPGLKEKLPPTDSRLRPDQRYLENGEYGMANSEKLRLEQRQRQSGKMQERGWKPRWFAKQKGNSDAYCFIGGYWEAKEEGRWESCPDIFGQVPTDIQIF
ncbi:oxysterol-binding protein-related protein 1C-like isoform X1 [Rhododendron vialii]|uniref:oxysterol-binding protein-related protein 1C-like isoform X1 n=1 Tax=Rhododendron vialii TaxID=182163 RepID=UPI00265F12EB|nr:oxysterol-binding protein-related protein 1C-like isoform X1 [Rhododendron vialii]